MSEPEPSPEQEARVRDLLARARHDEPVPDDVAARLDRVLVELAAEETAGSSDRVADLAARRRRRGSWLLGAAACLVVGGVGAGQLLSESGGDLAGADSSFGQAAEESASDAGGDAGGRTTVTESLDEYAAPGPVRPAPSPTASAAVRVDEERFARDAELILSGGAADTRLASKDRRHAAAERDVPAAGWFSCDPAPWGLGHLVAVEYAGEPAVLALRPPAGDTRVVDLLECGTGAVLRSVTLPVS